MLNRILVISFIALFAITVIEVGVLLYGQIVPKAVQTSSHSILVPSPTPQFIPLLQRSIQNGSMVGSTLTNNFEGKITQIDTKGGIAPFNNLAYDTKIVISREINKSTPFYLSKEAILKITVEKIVDGNQVPITIDDLSISDTVKVKTVWQLNPQTGKYDQFIQGDVLKTN